MTDYSGMRTSSYNDPDNSFAVMAKAHDWVQYTLDLPMGSEPGTIFNYNSGATLILGHIFASRPAPI